MVKLTPTELKLVLNYILAVEGLLNSQTNVDWLKSSDVLWKKMYYLAGMKAAFPLS